MANTPPAPSPDAIRLSPDDANDLQLYLRFQHDPQAWLQQADRNRIQSFVGRVNRESALGLAVAHEIARLQHQEQQQQQQQWPASPSPSYATSDDDDASVAASSMLSRVPSSLGHGELVISLEQLMRLQGESWADYQEYLADKKKRQQQRQQQQQQQAQAQAQPAQDLPLAMPVPRESRHLLLTTRETPTLPGPTSRPTSRPTPMFELSLLNAPGEEQQQQQQQQPPPPFAIGESRDPAQPHRLDIPRTLDEAMKMYKNAELRWRDLMKGAVEAQAESEWARMVVLQFTAGGADIAGDAAGVSGYSYTNRDCPTPRPPTSVATPPAPAGGQQQDKSGSALLPLMSSLDLLASGDVAGIAPSPSRWPHGATTAMSASSAPSAHPHGSAPTHAPSQGQSQAHASTSQQFIVPSLSVPINGPLPHPHVM